jgi:hypothetical protein
MTREVVVCKPGQLLSDVWSIMKMRELKNIPVVNAESRPIGMPNARDALQLLLEEAQGEELLLRDYVMCVGYHQFRPERPKRRSQLRIDPPIALVTLESDGITPIYSRDEVAIEVGRRALRPSRQSGSISNRRANVCFWRGPLATSSSFASPADGFDTLIVHPTAKMHLNVNIIRLSNVHTGRILKPDRGKPRPTR